MSKKDKKRDLRTEVMYRGHNHRGDWVEGEIRLSSDQTWLWVLVISGLHRGMMKIKVNEKTLGRFVTEHNGVRIFEGDLLCDTPTDVDGQMIRSAYPVVYDERNLRWALDVSFKKDMGVLEPLSDWLYESENPVEIAGNIHDNPELINQ